MEVRDEKGETRLDAAKRLLKERLNKVPEEVGLVLIAYDVRPEVLQARTLKRRELLSRLEAVTSRPIPGRTDLALESARMLAGLEPPAAIWHVSDQLLRQGKSPASELNAPVTDPLPPATIALPLPDNIVLRELNLGLPEVSNAGITALQLRPVPLEHSRYDVYVEVALNADAPAPLTIPTPALPFPRFRKPALSNFSRGLRLPGRSAKKSMRSSLMAGSRASGPPISLSW